MPAIARLAGAVAFALLSSAGAAQAAGCTSLANLALKDVEVTSAAEVVPAPVWDSPHQRSYAGRVTEPFCRVQGLIEGHIGFEVWLPAKQSWTGRLLGAGVGGNAGIFNYSDMARGVNAGFAALSTDSGHKITENRWMMDARKRESYAHRAVHLTTVAAKRFTAAYYGAPSRFDYFIGCSGGGRQALKEVQAYPDDYDGVIAGAPGPNMPLLSARHLWGALLQQQNPAGALSDADWGVVQSAVLAQCDTLDGVKDGVLEDPRVCRFDPATVELPQAKVTTLRALYSPLRDEQGRVLDQGLFPGVRTRPGPPPPLLLELFAQGVHGDPNWDPANFRIDRDVEAVHQKMPQLRADNPDPRPFRDAGGKLIIYTGWDDPSVIAQQSLSYHAAVKAKVGPSSESFTRLYLAPGVHHCGGGPGPDVFGGSGRPSPVSDARHDMLWALVDWVERGRAPGELIASKVENGQVVRTRPLCPFPQVARYRGGDINRAESFACTAP